jgi:hypothetical protein
MFLNKALLSSTKRTSSIYHCELTCSHHDIDAKLLSWQILKFYYCLYNIIVWFQFYIYFYNIFKSQMMIWTDVLIIRRDQQIDKNLGKELYKVIKKKIFLECGCFTLNGTSKRGFEIKKNVFK